MSGHVAASAALPILSTPTLITHSLTVDAAKSLVQGLHCKCRLDYCNSLLSSITDRQSLAAFAVCSECDSRCHKIA